MSDFFTRLAERTLGLALIIQPIKPSLFAPEQNHDDETLFEIAEESSVTQTFSHTPPGTDIAVLSPASDRMATHDRAAEASVARPAYIQAEQPLPAATRERQTLDFNSLPVAPPINSMHGIPPRSNVRRQQAARSNYRHVPTAEQRSAHAEQARASTIGTVSPHPLIEQEHSNDGAKRSTLTDSNTRLDGSNISERYMEAPGIADTSPLLHEQTPAQQALLGERSGYRPQSAIIPPAARTQTEASMSEPAIQVTIGRVEVRAVTAPTPPARQPQQHARPAAMSLDEYMRRQEQGGGR